MSFETLLIFIKMYCKTIFFSVIDNTLAKILKYRKNILETIYKLIMIIDEKIRDEKLQYDISREAAKISALSSGKIDKCKYLTREEILPPDQRRVIEEAKPTYSPLEKDFEKQIETTEDQREKQIKALQEHEKQLVKSENETGSSTQSKQK